MYNTINMQAALQRNYKRTYKRYGGRRLGKYADVNIRGNRLYMPFSNSPMPIAIGRNNAASSGRRRLAPASMLLTPDNNTMQGISYSPLRSAPSASQTTRQHGTHSDITEVINHRKLYVDPVPFPSQGAQVGLRLGTTIRVSGIHICETIANPSDKPVLLHYCVLQPKDRGITDVNQVRAAFFRNTRIDPPSGDPPVYDNNRTSTFTDAQNGDAFDYSYSCNPLNPDKFYILKHQKIILSQGDITPDGQATVITNGVAKNSYWHFDHYFKLAGKRMTFTTAADTTPEHPILRVYWFQVLSGKDWTPASNQSIALTRDHKTTVYFKNGLN